MIMLAHHASPMSTLQYSLRERFRPLPLLKLAAILQMQHSQNWTYVCFIFCLHTVSAPSTTPTASYHTRLNLPPFLHKMSCEKNMIPVLKSANLIWNHLALAISYCIFPPLCTLGRAYARLAFRSRSHAAAYLVRSHRVYRCTVPRAWEERGSSQLQQGEEYSAVSQST